MYVRICIYWIECLNREVGRLILRAKPLFQGNYGLSGRQDIKWQSWLLGKLTSTTVAGVREVLVHVTNILTGKELSDTGQI